MRHRKRTKQFSPSREFAEFGKQIFFGFKIGIMQSDINAMKSKFEPYKLPYKIRVQSYVPFNENTIEDIKRWYDIDYESEEENN